MTELSKGGESSTAEPEIRRRRFSPIWILPIVALLVAGWLAYTTFAEKGPTITIAFRTAEGLEAGKTRIKHHDIDLGLVQRINPSPDLSQVIVTAQMNKMAADHLKSGTNFWVVRPRFTGFSVSGLETLVSGAYIEMDPGPGSTTHAFKGLEQPPVQRSDVPGTTYVLTTSRLGSVDTGSPLFFRGIQVGETIGYTFGGLNEPTTVRVFVRKPYDELVHDNTRFWNASGISIGAGAGGFKFEIESLQAVLAGGIAFETPDADGPGKPAKADTTFPLYDDKTAADDAAYTKRARAIVEFEGSVRGLEVGAPVELRGIKIGTVADFRLVVDAAHNTARVPVVLDLYLDRVGIINLPPEELGKGGLIADLVARGLRAQLQPASLITGQLLVAFDFFPDAPPAQIIATDTYPKLPTVPGEMAGLTRSLNQVLDKVAALPVEDVVWDLRKTLGAASQLMQDANVRLGPLITSLRQTSDAAEAGLKSLNAAYGRDSQTRNDIADLLKQLQGTARSAKLLVDYLERHPEAVIRGRSGSPQ